MPKLRATSSFRGTNEEGFIKAGTVFEADQERADKLVDQLRLAEYAEEDAEVTHDNRELEDLTKSELLEKAEQYNVDTVSDRNTKAEIIQAIEASPDYQNRNYTQPDYNRGPGGDSQNIGSEPAPGTDTASDADTE